MNHRMFPCVILSLDCPWDLNDPGWAAVFVDEKLLKVDRDIVDCVYLGQSGDRMQINM